MQRVSLRPILFVFWELYCSSEYTSVWAHKALDVFPTVVMFNYKGWPSKSEWFEVVIEFHRWLFTFFCLADCSTCAWDSYLLTFHNLQEYRLWLFFCLIGWIPLWSFGSSLLHIIFWIEQFAKFWQNIEFVVLIGFGQLVIFQCMF